MHAILLTLCVAGVLAHEPDAADFTREAALRRFDANSDGKLADTEERALREAYGGIDVPLLPVEPYRYTEIERPKHFDGQQLSEADNTPPDNPTTDAGAALGRVLFYDRQLSGNGTVACASCHHQASGFADPRRFSVGYRGGLTGRNSMGLANLRFSNLRGGRPGFFWDERATSLEDQALMPIQDPVEMGMTLPRLEAKLAELPYYPPLFAASFGSREITSERVARALAQFVRSLESWGSKFDREADKAGGDYAAEFDGLSEQENLGKSLVIRGAGGVAEFGCAHCHMPPTFGMPMAMNNGLDLEYRDPGLGKLDREPNDPFSPSNDGKFKAPSLRNVELSAPYMHDGRFETLQEVVAHYSGGVRPHPNLALAFPESDSGDPPRGFGFSDSEQSALVVFLKTLTDRRFTADSRFSDPFVREPDSPRSQSDRKVEK